jgi:hypothetical protein
MLIAIFINIVCLVLPFIVLFSLRGGTSNRKLSIYLPEMEHEKKYKRYGRLVFIVIFLFFSSFLMLYDMANHHTMFGYMYESHKWW